MAQKIGYQIHSSNFDNAGYKKLYVDILVETWDRFERLGKFEFQADRERDYWYGMHFETEGQFSGLKDQIKFMQRLDKSEVLYFGQNPENLINWLDNLHGGVGRMVYDSRLHRYVAIDEVPDSNLDLWLDVQPDSDNCTINVLAYDENDAREKAEQKLAEEKYYNKLVKWIENGKQVRCANSGYYPVKSPKITPIEDILKI